MSYTVRIYWEQPEDGTVVPAEDITGWDQVSVSDLFTSFLWESGKSVTIRSESVIRMEVEPIEDSGMKPKLVELN